MDGRTDGERRTRFVLRLGSFLLSRIIEKSVTEPTPKNAFSATAAQKPETQAGLMPTPAPKAEAKLPYPGHADFLLNTPLYAKFARPTPDELRELFFSGVKVDGHCPGCGRETTFTSTNTMTQWGNGYPGRFGTASLSCARVSTHVINIWVGLTKWFVEKVGQDPSHADIANDQSKPYRSVLSKADAAEFHMATGLAAHGVGIGSFVYLRRIFERLIWQRFDEFEVTESWDRADFTKLPMGEKVALMKNHLPDFLVENFRLYSIMSLGVHELSEEQCIAFFPILRESTLTILDEDKRKKAELERRASLKKAIQNFEGGQGSAGKK